MAGDLPCTSFMALYVISMHLIHGNSRQSNHWKLNLEDGKVSQENETSHQPDDDDPSKDNQEDLVMNILTKKETLSDGGWRIDKEIFCEECERNRKLSTSHNPTENVKNTTKVKPLECGKLANSTQYDHLRGIANRKDHPAMPEPEVAMIFNSKKGKRNSQVDMSELEKKLRRLRQEKPKSAQTYNQIGNFWRIKGNTQLSIECFRKALSISPNNADILLNLARVLFNLQYLDDAIFLTRRSLEMQSPEQNSWLQHFTLGEILKAYGHFQESTLHFRHTLDLNPGFQPAQAHLREMETNHPGSVTYYTLFIIVFLVFGVLIGIILSIENLESDCPESMKTSRHFNRAMAMRSIKLGISPNKIMRMKKCTY